MPIKPAKTRSCSRRSSSSSSASVPAGTERNATPSVRSACAASASFVLRISRASLVAQRPSPFTDQLLRAAREQHVRRAFREYQDALATVGVGVNGAHQLALRRERHFTHPLETGHRAPRLEARLSARPRSARPRSDRPVPSIAPRAPAARRCWRGRPPRARDPAPVAVHPSIAPPPSSVTSPCGA